MKNKMKKTGKRYEIQKNKIDLLFTQKEDVRLIQSADSGCM